MDEFADAILVFTLFTSNSGHVIMTLPCTLLGGLLTHQNHSWPFCCLHQLPPSFAALLPACAPVFDYHDKCSCVVGVVSPCMAISLSLTSVRVW